MSNNNLNQCDFKLVSYKRKRAKPNIHDKINTATEPLRCPYSDVESSIRRVEAAKQELLTTDLYSSVLASLREGLQILHQPVVKEIVCFGVGRIGECMIARYQLALLLCLRDLHDVETHIYDPVFNETDRNILSALKFDVLPNNTEGKYCVKGRTTLFYLPHCSKQLSNNLLWANWGLQLSHCIIIANSFTKILESHSKHHVTENAQYILSASPYVTELAVINSFKYYDIFNDTAIHIFPFENVSLVSPDFWQYHSEPKYSDEDVEFISNEMNTEIKLCH